MAASPASDQRPSSGTGAKLMREHERGDEHDRQDAAEVVDRVGRLVHVAGHEPKRHHERDDRQRQRDEEHRAPPEVLEQPPAMSGPSAEMAPPIADHSAIDLRPRRARPTAR